MNINKKAVSIVLALIASAAPFLWGLYDSWRENHFSCTSEVTLRQGEETYEVAMRLSFDNGVGALSSVGFINANERNSSKVIRKMNFHYFWNRNYIELFSDGPTESPAQLHNFTNIIPDFFLSKNRGVKLQFIKNNAGGYLVRMNDVPAFYCRFVNG